MKPRALRLAPILPIAWITSMGVANANGWTLRAPGAPSVRHGSLAYDGTNHRMIFAGGVSTNGALFTGTWAYQPGQDRWTDLAPSVAYPPPGAAPGLAADEGGRVVMFDGKNTSVYDPAANAWTPLSPATAPSLRTGVELVWDPIHHRAVSFGGSSTSANCPSSGFCGDLWAFDPLAQSWTELASSIPAEGRESPQVGFDPKGGEFVLFSGLGNYNINTQYPNDTWTLDPVTNLWVQQFPGDALPIERTRGKIAYAGSGALVLFGGRSVVFGNETDLGDTWIYLPAIDRWTWAGSLSPSPGVRTQFAMAYDASNRELVLVDGGETWVYDLGLSPSLDAGPPTVPQLYGYGWYDTFGLSWTPSVDDTLVGGYRIYVDGGLMASVTGTTFGATIASGTYQFEVAAWDLVGNTSGRSAPVTVTVLPFPCDYNCEPSPSPFGGCRCSLRPDGAAKGSTIACALVGLVALLLRRRLRSSGSG